MTSLKFWFFIDLIDNAFLGHLDLRCVKQGPQPTLLLPTFVMSSTI
jgi:hypothetical protein